MPSLDRTHINLINPLEYGTSCTLPTLTAALAVIGATRCGLVLTGTDRSKAAQIWTISDDLTIPENVDLYIPHGSRVSITSGKTLTVSGMLHIDSPLWLQSGTTGQVNVQGKGQVVEVHKFATSGVGSSASPWTGWHTALTFNEGVTYHFGDGQYNLSTVISIAALRYIKWEAVNRATLNYTGGSTTDPVVTFNGNGSSNGMEAVVKNIRIDGKGNAAHGFGLDFVVHGSIEQCSVTNVTSAGFRSRGCILTSYINPAVSSNLGTYTTEPAYGMLWDKDLTSGNICSANYIENIRMEGKASSPTMIGVYEKLCQSNVYVGGTLESLDVGFDSDLSTGSTVGGSYATVEGVFFESNVTANVRCGGFLNKFVNCIASGGLFLFKPVGAVGTVAAYLNTISGGQWGSITISAACSLNALERVFIAGAGVLTDNGADTYFKSVFVSLTGLTPDKTSHYLRVPRIVSPLDSGGNPVPILLVPGGTQDIWIGDNTGSGRMSFRRLANTNTATLGWFTNNVGKWSFGPLDSGNEDFSFYNLVHGAASLKIASADSAITTGGPLKLGGSLAVKNVTTVNDAAYTVLASDTIVAYTALSAGRIVTLPAPVNGKVFIIQDQAGNANTFNLTVTAPGGSSINGAGTKVINTAYGRLLIYSDGTNYFAV